ncbi:DUF3857 domain-containing protein [Hymenobacter sp. H14-R3]|uniref:DUF3857 domain-containing protein n=1 Tax=Hymenobacter sp. H14-R3 TaxID=3046308 RepID=UPI0024BAB984|nr:DUF3857 domain-containing protein [Hymenobacter sp. H14-R3]MDJ0365734.1 DUF3857 domain-containing protein [Hymenobacter sp. H14-R3]
MILLMNGLPASCWAQTHVPPAAFKGPPPVRFGQPEAADFEAKNFVADSGAAAVVLCDYGTSRFASPGGEMCVIHERVVRLKILKKAGYDYATVEVPLYHRDENKEKLSNLRGFTYVRGADGKILRTKLDDAGVFVEKRTDRVNVQKFTLPAVQEGAVVEYAYTITSSMLSDYPGWTFQRDIPTRWSEYRFSYPMPYRYKMLYHGYVPLATSEESTGSVALILTRRAEFGAGAGIDVGSTGVSMTTEQHRLIVRNAPAVRAEPYITTPDDYLTRITCELAGIQWPEEQYRDLADSWPKKNGLLLKHEEFGLVLNHAGFLADVVRPAVQANPDPAARAAAVRALVLQAVKYDGSPRLLTSGSLKHTWEQRRGNSADVNLLLVAALRQAGLVAQPLLLSTRAHGYVSQEYPLLDQFNYVLAAVELPGGHDLLLDATEPLLTADALPLRCLNKIGHTVPAEGEGRWVSLAPSLRYTHYQEVKMTLDAQGGLTSQAREDFGGYAGLAAREKLAQLGEKKFAAELASEHPSWEMPSYQLSGTTNLGQPLSISYTLRQPAETATTAEELYVKPLATFSEDSNPFQLAERSFPVDFGMLRQEVISLTLTLPAGYTAELPKPTTLALPDQGGRYVYAASSPAPGTVQLLSRLTLDKPVYSAQEYHALRELYRQMLAKQAEALVIKKAGS